MDRFLLISGDEHGRVIAVISPDSDSVVYRSGIWMYVATDQVDEQGRRIAVAWLD